MRSLRFSGSLSLKSCRIRLILPLDSRPRLVTTGIGVHNKYVLELETTNKHTPIRKKYVVFFLCAS